MYLTRFVWPYHDMHIHGLECAHYCCMRSRSLQHLQHAMQLLLMNTTKLTCRLFFRVLSIIVILAKTQ